MDLLGEALAKGLPALDEYGAKRFLSVFGIPVNRETLAYDPEEAAAAAETIGFPVVLKVSGSTLYHKTETGSVVLSVKSSNEVKEESRRLLKIPGCQALLSTWPFMAWSFRKCSRAKPIKEFLAHQTGQSG